MANNFWNFWERREPPAPGPRLRSGGLTTGREEVAELLAQAREIDDQMAELRDKKRAISRRIENIDARAQAALPPNPKGTMTIG